MDKIGRNDLCPCGSGKKFKRCHLGKEDQLTQETTTGEFSPEDSARITSLPEVSYGRSREMLDGWTSKNSRDLRPALNSLTWLLTRT